jgi:transposase
VYRRELHRRVVLIIDHAPWHAGEAVDAALRDNLHLGLRQLPAYSPRLKPMERLWRVLRRRATHNRPSDTLGDLKRSVRNSLCYFQDVRSRVVSLVEKSFRRKATASAAS